MQYIEHGGVMGNKEKEELRRKFDVESVELKKELFILAGYGNLTSDSEVTEDMVCTIHSPGHPQRLFALNAYTVFERIQKATVVASKNHFEQAAIKLESARFLLETVRNLKSRNKILEFRKPPLP